MRWHTAGPLLLLLVSVALSAAGSAGPCPGGRPTHGDVGLRGLTCKGPTASCAIHVDSDGPRRHELAVEPTITEIAPDYPAGGKVAPGDVLVAVDGYLVTTAEGGRRLANMEVGHPVALLIRREGQLREVVLVPRAGCGIRRLTVRR